MMAELFGRADGTCHGKGGSMHIADPRFGILGANGIVGAGLPIAVGAGLAAQRRGSGAVAVAFAGEGSVHGGPFHEALTLAVLWRAPVVFVIENNQFSEFTRSEEIWRGAPLVERALDYGLHGAERVDGNDVAAVREAAARAVAAARAGLRALADRGADLPRARPLRGRRDALPRRGGVPRVARPRPARAGSPARCARRGSARRRRPPWPPPRRRWTAPSSRGSPPTTRTPATLLEDVYA